MLEIAEENQTSRNERLFISAGISALWIMDYFFRLNNVHPTELLVTSHGIDRRHAPVATQQALQKVITETLLFDCRLSRHNLYEFLYLIPSHTYLEWIHFLLSQQNVHLLFLGQLLADARKFSVCVLQGSILSRFFFSVVF